MLTQKQLLHINEVMHRIRAFETRAMELYKQGVVTGSIHLYIGEEAVAATACEMLGERDYITSTHRGDGHCIAKGMRTDRMMAELYGRDTGYSHGKGGSMHISDLSLGNLGANGIVGGGMSIACGAAMSLGILKKNGGVVVCFFGEGASNEGVTHEAMNLASIWKLPIIFLCENNLYQVFTSVEESLSVKDVSVRATAYDMPGVTVDGNDVFALEEALSPAIQRARRGDGPSLIEAKTYRWDGHYPGDGYFMGGYRSVEEVQAWKERCPILFLENHLLNHNIVTRETLDEMKEQIHQEIDAAQKYAENSPWPEDARLLEDVFSEEAIAR